MQDTAYGDFCSALMPTVERQRVIGVRTPALRKYARFLEPERAEVFLRSLPHGYFEEDNLHAFLIERIGEYERTVAEIERFLPYVDNWATCDSMRPKILKKHTDELYKKVLEWIKSDHTYTVRYALGMLHSYFLDDRFLPEQLALAAGIVSDEYYINMMVAWYFATALGKQREHTLPYLTEGRLRDPIHNMTLRKAVESFRIPEEDKALCRSLRRKSTEKTK